MRALLILALALVPAACGKRATPVPPSVAASVAAAEARADGPSGADTAPRPEDPVLNPRRTDDTGLLRDPGLPAPDRTIPGDPPGLDDTEAE